MIQLRNVLVATDFSKTSEAALGYGRELARAFGAKLHVLHVADNIMTRYAFDGSVVLPPEVQADLEHSAQEQLDRLVGDDDRRALRAVAVVRTSTTPADSIVDYAKEADIDLIVIGTHGRRAVAHLLLGSVAEQVVRTSRTPVLVVRPPSAA
jgi:nucleotide-binding universal stress UspA family protein